MKLNDLTGKKFEHLIVLYRSDDLISKSGRHKVRWRCKCNCGNEWDVTASNLKSFPNMTCQECANKLRSEHNRINVVGNKYGRLTIVDIIKNTRPTKVVCKCDCGNTYVGLQADVVIGHTQSCGCLQREIASDVNTKDWAGAVSDYGVEFLSQDTRNSKGQWLWRCKCGVCGNEFIALPAKVMNGHITSCGCASMSSGERYIEKILNEIDAAYERQFIFSDCKFQYTLPFDFVVFDNNKVSYAIEYDGKQHFENIEWFGGEEEFQKRKIRDEIKTQYCKSNNIPLLRIPYTLSSEEIYKLINEYHLSVTTAGCA